MWKDNLWKPSGLFFLFETVEKIWNLYSLPVEKKSLPQ